jgi:hypothetical protein
MRLMTVPMTDLRTRIERGEYQIDAGLVADTMLSKVAVIRKVRRHLLTQAGRSQPTPAPHH